MKRIMLSWGILAAMVPGAASFCGAEQGLAYRDVRIFGMGGARTASGRGSVDFVNNPALLGRVDRVSFSLPLLPVYINRDLRDTGEFINDNRDRFENYDDLSTEEKIDFLNDIEPYDSQWGRMNVSPLVSVAAPLTGTSLGFAVYSTGDAGFKIDRGIFEPRVWGEGEINTIAVLGIAHSFDDIFPGLTLGANAKYIDRRTAPLFQIPATELGDVEETIEPIIDDWENNKETHVAADIGVLLDIPVIDSEIGAAVRNLGFADQSSVDIGISKRFSNDRVVVLADYIDLLDNNEENAFRKIHFGGELDLGVIELRAGINSGYPTAGVGLDFRVLHIDAAYFSDELSNSPGVD
ncbi:MAG: hypothetical protein ACYC9O_10850 [Candidatus Latescibacterota bacterium]